MKLRKMIALDLESVSALGIRSKASWGYDSEMMSVFADELTLSEADFEALSDAQVATVSGRIVGYFTLKFHEADHFIELDHLFVDPNYFGRGIGRELLFAAIESAKKFGVPVMKIITDPNATDFYLKHGARRVGFHDSVDIPRRRIPRVEIPLGS